MDELLSGRPKGSTGLPDKIEHLDPFLERRLEQRPWEVRSAQWRAWALAEAVFGKGVEVRLSGKGGYQVPFSTLGEHRDREAIFLAWAEADPVLAQVPVLYVFEPAPAQVPRP
jgi:hypothetical protein